MCRLYPPFGEIVILITQIWKDSISNKLCPLYLFVFSTHLNPNIWISSFFYSIVKFHLPTSSFAPYLNIARCISIKLSPLDFGSAHCAVVGLDGLEPSTSRLSGARSSHLSYRPVSLRYFSSSISQGFTLDGGDEGIRTLDPLLAGQVLSQLSYTPILGFYSVSRLFIESWQLNNKIYLYNT